MIDVGGPSMLRGAAKNFAHVRAGLPARAVRRRARRAARATATLSLETRRALAAEAFATTAAYEAAIATLVRRPRGVPGARSIARASRRCSTSRTARTRTSAPRTTPSAAPAATCSRASSSCTARSSRSTTSTTSRPRALLAREFALPACVIVKHANPCGVAVGGTIEEAYDEALARRPGLGLRRRRRAQPAGRRRARRAARRAVRRGAVRARLRRTTRSQRCARSRRTRILVDRERRRDDPGERDYKRVLGGLLVQDRDADVEDREGMERRLRRARRGGSGATSLFAWRVCKHVTSNAIVLAKDLQTIGIGAGQMSRVDAVRIAVEKAREHGHDLDRRGARLRRVLPVRRTARSIALDAGVDGDRPAGRLEARRRGDRRRSSAAGATMVFTGRRHFRH